MPQNYDNMSGERKKTIIPHLTDPHIRLVTINTTVGKENEVLVGELGSLAQAILYRLHQPEFQITSFFSVRILVVRNYKLMVLIVRADINAFPLWSPTWTNLAGQL